MVRRTKSGPQSQSPSELTDREPFSSALLFKLPFYFFNGTDGTSTTLQQSGGIWHVVLLRPSVMILNISDMVERVEKILARTVTQVSVDEQSKYKQLSVFAKVCS